MKTIKRLWAATKAAAKEFARVMGGGGPGAPDDPPPGNGP